MLISTGRSRKDIHWKGESFTWLSLLDRLRYPHRTDETVAQYAAMTVDQQAEIKDVGGFVGGELYGPRRKADAVKCRCLVTLDADHVPSGVDLWRDYTCLYGDTCAMYSTHKHHPEAPRLRFVIPLTRTVTPEEYQPLARKLAERIGIDCMDITTYAPERLMYWPSCPSDGEYLFRQLDGDVVDPDAVLAEYGAGEGWRDASLWPIGATETEAHQRESRELGSPEDRPGTVGLFCRTYDVPTAIELFLSDVYAPVDGDDRRYTYIPGTTSAGAVVYGDGAWLYSHHSTDPCGDGHIYNAYDLVRVHRFNGDGKAMDRWVDSLDEVKQQLISERRRDMADLTDSDCDTPVPAPARLTASGETDAAITVTGCEVICAPPDGENWETHLTINSKSKAIESTAENLRLIMANDAELRGRIGRNTFTTRPAIRGIVPWRRSEAELEEMRKTWLNGGEITIRDSDEAGLRWYLETTYGITDRAKVGDALHMAIDDVRNQFHPVRDYLDSLTWDGVERLDTMLIRWMGADDTKLNRTMTRKWAVGAVKRIYQPGCKFDTMLVMVGEKGIGKSRFGRVLSHEPHGKWFSDSLGDISTKESYSNILGKWIVEIAELSSFVKSELEDVKRFLAASSDYYRQPYSTYAEDFPRQCVFIGSTNTLEFIKDQAGERRFWPVLCHGFNGGWHIGLEEEVDMLWAEAKYRLEHGEVPAFTSEEEKDMLAEVQSYFTQTDDLREELIAYLDDPLPADWATWDDDKRQRWFSGSMLREGVATPLRRNAVSRSDIRRELFHASAASGANRYDASSKRISDLMDTLPNWRKATAACRLYGLPVKHYYRVGTDRSSWPVGPLPESETDADEERNR